MYLNSFKSIKKIIFLILFLCFSNLTYAQNKSENIFFKTKNTAKLNSFEEENGLFRFQFKNNFQVKKYNNIYYLEDLKKHRPVFHLFINKNEISFYDKNFICKTSTKDQKKFKNTEICFSKKNYEAVFNLKLFVKPDMLINNKFQFFVKKNILKNDPNFNKYAFFTRAEALAFILKLKFPGENFAKHKADCFDDIKKDHDFAGYICFAKKKNIVRGIGNRFYPKRSINLWILKILFMAFKFDDLYFNKNFLDQSLFAEVKNNYEAYPLVAKAIYEGFLDNTNNETLWINKSIYKGEAIEIIYNFYQWLHGQKIKNYNFSEPSYEPNFLYYRYDDFILYTKEKKIGNYVMPETNIKKTLTMQKGADLEIFVLNQANLYERLFILPNTQRSEIKNIKVSFDPERIEGYLQENYKNGLQKTKKINVRKKDFLFIKNNFLKNKIKTIKNKLKIQRMNLLPNQVSKLNKLTIPKFKLYMSDDDFKNIVTQRTNNKRYKAFLEIKYPNNEVNAFSVLVKTRGHATRGYIKSSFTIEAFKKVKENEDFVGDEFLEEANEVKLRSFINEETMIHEKLFYQVFTDFGYPSPRFFEAMLEINGLSLGFFQITEPIKKAFFRDRNIETQNYYYSRNNDSNFTNLTFYKSYEKTINQYKIRGNEEKFINFIKSMEENDHTTFLHINKQNIFDYALLIYLLNANDSIVHNFYIYFDDKTQKWNIFPWDADACFEHIPIINTKDFIQFSNHNKEIFNNLIYFLFRNLNQDQIDFYLNNFLETWDQKINILDMVHDYEKKHEKYFKYDNSLWNGKFFERKKEVFDTMKAINNLKKDLKNLEISINNLKNNK